MNDFQHFSPGARDAFVARGWSPSGSSSSSSSSRNPILSSLLGITSRHSHHHYAQNFSPTKDLNDKIRAREWDAARIRVLSHPSDVFYKAKQRNKSTTSTLHLACLYRAPKDLVELILDANPKALLTQDSEGWTPIHVIILYGNDEETAIMLIRRGGKAAASIQSPIVGSPLHLAFQHGCSASIIEELLRVNPEMATTANEYSNKPARILWHHYSRNPENRLLLMELMNRARNGTFSTRNIPKERQENLRGLIQRLELLLQAANGKRPPSSKNGYSKPSVVMHDVVVSTDDASRLGNLSDYLPLVVVMYPEQLQSTDELGNFPLHKAASTTNRTNPLRRPNSTPSFASTTTTNGTASTTGDPVEILVQSYPIAAGIPNRLGLMPLHIALSQGRRTWRSGIACMVLAAPQALMMRCSETHLLPFQLAATMCHEEDSDRMQEDEDDDEEEEEDHNNIEIIETILELLLACPHAMTVSSQ